MAKHSYNKYNNTAHRGATADNAAKKLVWIKTPRAHKNHNSDNKASLHQRRELQRRLRNSGTNSINPLLSHATLGINACQQKAHASSANSGVGQQQQQSDWKSQYMREINSGDSFSPLLHPAERFFNSETFNWILLRHAEWAWQLPGTVKCGKPKWLASFYVYFTLHK